MSPELLDPQKFGFEKIRPTQYSDCYALGMVIYETISGRSPFYQHVDLNVVVKVLAGEHPPRKAGFADSLWKTLELCWTSQPKGRPSIEDVLRCLEGSSSSSGPFSPWVDDERDMDSDDFDLVNDSSGTVSHFVPATRLRGLNVFSDPVGSDLSTLPPSSDFGLPTSSSIYARPRGHLGLGQVDAHQDQLGSRALSRSQNLSPSPLMPSSQPSQPPSFLPTSPLRSFPSSPVPYSYPYQYQDPLPPQSLQLQPQPIPSKDVRNQQGHMVGFPMSQGSPHHYPGALNVPTVWQPPLYQNGAAGSSLWMSGNRNLLSPLNPVSFPSYISANSYHRAPYPAPSTSTGVWANHLGSGTSMPVSILHIKARSFCVDMTCSE